jgi:hypothetical protein
MHGFLEITPVTMKNFPTNRGDPQSILQGLSNGVVGSRRFIVGKGETPWQRGDSKP